MFIGEFLCCLPLLWSQLSRHSKEGQGSLKESVLWAFGSDTSGRGRYRSLETSADEGDDDEVERGEDTDDALTGRRMLWMWFPAFFDSEYTFSSKVTKVVRLMILVCGTTLMNVGLILTPVSIYQMSRGALVLWVGVLSVIFLRRHLWLYQWTALVIVVLGVCLVGLSGSLVKKTLDETPLDSLVRIATSDDEPAKVALGVILILFAQNFTACQYVSSIIVLVLCQC